MNHIRVGVSCELRRVMGHRFLLRNDKPDRHKWCSLFARMIECRGLLQYARGRLTKSVLGCCFTAALLAVNASARTAPDRTIPALRPGACSILIADQRQAVTEAIYERIVTRSSERLKRILPGASLSLQFKGPDVMISATGIKDGAIFIKGRAAWLKKTKIEDLDYLPAEFEESGEDPFLVFLVSEVRVQDYRSSGEDRFRRLGIGTILMNTMAEFTRVAGIRRVMGLLDITNKWMFCEKYGQSHDVVQAADYSFMGQTLRNAGYRVDVENSLVTHQMGPTCEKSALYVTWVRDRN